MMTPGRPSVAKSGTWQLPLEARQLESNAIVAETSFPPDSPWFSGHFPGEPILPGVAQIALVETAIQQVHGSQWRVGTIKRTRFKQIIEPGDRIELLIEPQQNSRDTFTFQISTKEEVTASGIVVMIRTK